MELLASGYGLIEGPRVDDALGLYFSDVQNGGVYLRAPDGSIETIVPRRRGVGGIALHVAGGLVISGRNICHVRDGETRILFERADIGGFNDLFTDSKGRVYTGTLRSDPFAQGGPRTAGECWRIDVSGEAVEVYDDVALTNGIGFSPDGTRLYHSDTARNHVIAHDVTPEGGVKNRSVFCELSRGAPDGLAVDADGGVWVAAYGGGCVLRFAPNGALERSIEVPARAVTSLCFGGPDLRDLYIVSADNTDDASLAGCIFRTRAPLPGLRAPRATI